MSFEELYKKLTKEAMHNNLKQELINLKNSSYDDNHLDCLLYPEKHPPVWKLADCECDTHDCLASCIFNAIELKDGNMVINKEKCTSCALCIEACKNANLTYSRDVLTAIDILHNSKTPVYALVAPAYVGQFGKNATSGQVRSALKRIGFTGMVEVATFADILTFKEALEFNHNISSKKDFQLASCCCPVWIALIRKKFDKIISHLPPSVSPMIACGRVIKELHPEAATIFIGPCLAKKSEAKEPDLVGAIDCVLTFNEVADIFEVTHINVAEEDDIVREHSSFAGRSYARTGGVSLAVENAVKRISPDAHAELISKQANGVKSCKTMLDDIENGNLEANFYEGMGCDGGCVGGPRVIIDKELGKEYVDDYARKAPYMTPIDNPYVIDLLHRLGFETVKDFIENSKILVRDFGTKT